MSRTKLRVLWKLSLDIAAFRPALLHTSGAPARCRGGLQPTSRKRELFSPAPYDIQHQREDDAEEQRRRQGEIECCLLAAVENVSWQAAEREAGAAEQGQEKPCNHQDDSKKDQQFAQIRHDELSFERSIRRSQAAFDRLKF